MLPSSSERQALSDFTQHTLSQENIQVAVVCDHPAKTTGVSSKDLGGTDAGIDEGAAGLKRKASVEPTDVDHKRQRQQALLSSSSAPQEVQGLQAPTLVERGSETAESDVTDPIIPVAGTQLDAPLELRVLSPRWCTLLDHLMENYTNLPLPTEEEQRDNVFLDRRAFALLTITTHFLAKLERTIPPPLETRPPCGFNYAPAEERPSYVAMSPMCPLTYDWIIECCEAEPEEDIPTLHNALAWQSENDTPQICWDLTDCGIELEYHRKLDGDLERSAFDPPQESIVLVHVDGAVRFCVKVRPRPGRPYLTLACVVRGLHYVLQHERAPRLLWDEMNVYHRLHAAHTIMINTSLPMSHPIFFVIEHYRAKVNEALFRAEGLGHHVDERTLDIFPPFVVKEINELLSLLFVSGSEDPMAETTFHGKDLLIGNTMFMGLQYLGPPDYWQLKTTTPNIARMRRTVWDRHGRSI